MLQRAEALFADLARSLGVPTPVPDANGGVELTVGGDNRVVLFAEDAFTLLLVVPVMTLPTAIDYGRALWLLRRNFYDSPIAPFRVSCDEAGSLVVWGRVPMEGLQGEQLAGFIDALASEATLIREEVEVDTTEQG